MSTVQQDSQAPRACVRNGVYPRARRRFHRIAAVRQEQGMSLRSVSRRLGVDVRDLRYQECETTDLRLSDLYRWQKALGGARRRFARRSWCAAIAPRDGTSSADTAHENRRGNQGTDGIGTDSAPGRDVNEPVGRGDA